MHPSARRAYTPLIKFIGKRTWPSGMYSAFAALTCSAISGPTPPHAHPAGVPLPAGFSKSVPEHGPSKSSAGPAIFSEFWDAPKRFWMRELSADEMTAIESGGASKW
ncbi:hypothetical protein CPB85DRAFT_1311925 [Mucidula mucida]|nr:hypothetical protein CPB85DRAFT_1311925 [Mucidula mucida]